MTCLRIRGSKVAFRKERDSGWDLRQRRTWVEVGGHARKESAKAQEQAETGPVPLCQL